MCAWGACVHALGIAAAIAAGCTPHTASHSRARARAPALWLQVMLVAQGAIGLGTIAMANGVATSAIVRERSHS